MATALLIVALVLAVFAADANANKVRDLEQERDKLLGENAKLANHVLAAQGEHLLLPEDTPSPDDPKYRQELVALLLPKTGIPESPSGGPERLLDLLEAMDATGMRSEPHSEESVNDACCNLDPVVTLEFGDLAIRDLVPRKLRSWSPDLIYKGKLVAILTGSLGERARRIFDLKIADMAAKSARAATGREG